MKQQNQVTEITLRYNPKISASELPSASTAEEAYRLFLQNWNADTLQLQEEFKVMLLNRANKVLGIVTTSCGGMNATVADPKLIFAVALKGAASSIIVALIRASLKQLKNKISPIFAQVCNDLKNKISSGMRCRLSAFAYLNFLFLRGVRLIHKPSRTKDKLHTWDTCAFCH